MSVQHRNMPPLRSASTRSCEPARQEAKLTIRTIAIDYCRSTAMHGVRYFVDSSRSVTERVFWMVAVFISLFVCFQHIEQAWKKWETSPVIVSFAEAPLPMWELPFTAVTICPLTKIPQSVLNFTDLEHRMLDHSAGTGDPLAEEEIRKYEMASLLCPSSQKRNVSHTEDALQFLREVSPSIDEVLVECHWQGQRVENCSELFHTVMSEEGICYSFNVLDEREMYSNDTVQWLTNFAGGVPSSNWSREMGYSDYDLLKSYPRRVLGVGLDSGLQLRLRSLEEDHDFLCWGAGQGFKVVLHSPDQEPSVAMQYIQLPLNASLIVAVQPSIMTTSEGVRNFAPARRLCLFPSERGLRFYREYTQENCIFECLANSTLEQCNCVLPHMPKALIHTEIKQISASNGDGYSGRCQCLPTCLFLEYESETSFGPYNWPALYAARRDNATKHVGRVSLSQITVYFRQFQVIASRRTELYGPMDFLANCGGLLGLFSGFSVLSMVELIYFSTLRLYCDVHRRASKLKGDLPQSTGQT